MQVKLLRYTDFKAFILSNLNSLFILLFIFFFLGGGGGGGGGGLGVLIICSNLEILGINFKIILGILN